MKKCPQCLHVSGDDFDVCEECGSPLEVDSASADTVSEIDEERATKILMDVSMTPEKWKKIKLLFESAKDVPESDRVAFLERESAGDASLVEEVGKLLSSFREDDRFLEESAVAEVASLIEEGDGKPADGKRGEKESASFAKDSVLDERYHILKLIGKGGMGEVYLAKDGKLSRRVALKVLPEELTESKTRLLRFQQEARAVSALNHPHILTLFEFGKTEDGTHFIVTEYVEGQTLNDLGVKGTLELGRVLDVAIQVSSALAAAHQAGITHRDIKPDNVMVRDDGYIKVLDFGLAKLTEEEPVDDLDTEATTKALMNTAPGAVMGTAAYMSPEQARGLPVDARSDLWSLGVVIYEMLTGQRPFTGDTSTDTIISVIKKEPPPLSSYVADLPVEIEWAVSKLLSKDLDARYQTAKELHADLEKIKKRVEYNTELERSGMPVQSSEAQSLSNATINLEHTTIDGDRADHTRELTPDLRSAHSSHPESSLEYAVTQAASHKVATSVILLLVLVAASAGIYFAYFAGGSGEIDSIAVLPFEDGSQDADLKYLSDGISESLIDRLSQVSQLKVIARNSSFKFRGENIDVQDVAEKLGVRAIIMGRVAQIGDDLSIRVEVIDAYENKQLWGEHFQRQAKDVLAIQNEIAQTVSEKLRLKLTEDEETRLTNGGTTDSEAYRYYLNGLVELRGPTDVRGKALDYFLKAVEIDPDFALAYTEISFIYSGRASGSGNPRELMPKAKEATKKALAIDNKLAKAHVALATVLEYEFDWIGAEREYKLAIELNPNLDFARTRYAFFLSIMGRHEDAMRQIDEAVKRDPVNERSILLWKSIISTQARRFDEAIELYREVENLEPRGTTLYFDLGYAFAGQGKHKEASEQFEKSVEKVGGKSKYSQALIYLAASYAKMPEKREEAVAIAQRLENTDEYVSPALIAIIYTALGENNKAVQALERAYAERDLLLRYIGVGYEYDGLRKDRRFKDLLKRTGLPVNGV